MSEALPPALAAWQAFLARYPATASVDLILPDLVGIARGKRLTAQGFASGLTGALSFPGSLYGMDSTGANVDASGLIWEQGDPDRPCRVDPSTFAPVPWRAGGAQVLAGLGDPDGGPSFADPRALLGAVAGRFTALGLQPVCALELEFYLLDPRLGRDGRAQPLYRHAAAAKAHAGQLYGLDALDQQEDFFACLSGYCDAQELPAKAAASEYATGQYEVNLGHVADPLRAADQALLLKRAIRAAAREVGALATFMAKPFEDRSGSGLHIHVSLEGRDGRNRFAVEPAALGHAIAGLQATMAESMLFCAPNANSYRRLRPLSYAPLAATWGHDNRTVALRVPSGPPVARRIEHRLAGADASPYLVLAAVLAGIHHGLAHRLEPGPQTLGNAYATVEPDLPISWERAQAALESATVLPGYLGEAFCRLYRVCRAAERARFEEVVTPLEHSWYLRTV
jgi:glutamine synthetase